MNRVIVTLCFLLALAVTENTFSATDVPPQVQQPGTQPGEIGNLESPDKCDNCHGGYNSAVEPAHNWRGSMMSHAGRDPIFWATVAIAEQDFDGVGDLCIRCHSTGGWLAGRSTPTDGSGLAAGDSDGVDCDYCHKLTNPDDQDESDLGVMNEPFIANDESDTVMWKATTDPACPRCGAAAINSGLTTMPKPATSSCNRISIATWISAAPAMTCPIRWSENWLQITASCLLPKPSQGGPGSGLGGQVAFNNPPHRYGVVERTFSEYKSGAISKTKVDEYPSLPFDLRGGVLEAIYQAATNGGAVSANYQNPEQDRYYSCQTCHMRPVTGTGANKRGVPVRRDLPLHDMTGGNYWMPSVIEYLDDRGKLRLGGGMTSQLTAAMNDGALRAQEQLRLAASLEVEGHELKVINHTGHKLISGYPEGRRMWLNISWFDSAGSLLREDGAYGTIGLNVEGFEVESIQNLNDPYLHIYQAHMGMTSEWASELIRLGTPEGLALSFNRNDMNSTNPTHTLGELAGMAPGESLETFHFALNNTVISDNRIPPYGMSYDEAKRRNASPVPPDQYEGSPGGVYEYYDEIDLAPPAGAKSASIDLLYQPTSWEYIQFLTLANDGSVPFLANEGANMLEAWLNLEMAAPFVMASASWHDEPSTCETVTPTLVDAVAGNGEIALSWAPAANEVASHYYLYYDQAGKAQSVTNLNCLAADCSYTDSGLTNGQNYCYKLTAAESPLDCQSGFSNTMCATPKQAGQQQAVGVASIETGKWVRSGKGKNATETFVFTDSFSAGDQVTIRMLVNTESGTPVSGATISLAIDGPESTAISSTVSGNDGVATASWATQRPNKKGNGGTSSGFYTATVTAVSSSQYDWDDIASNASFTIGQTSGAMMVRKHH